MLYKGYVPTRNKISVIPLKEAWDYEAIKNNIEYAGVLDDTIILIDIDDRAESDILLNIIEDLGIGCRIYETARGKHFLFANPGIERNFSRSKLAIGLTADAKLGAKNSYEVLRINGQDRKILKDGDPDKLPSFLYPVKSSINFKELSEGDGRNQTLFNYILTLQSEGFTKEDIKECIEIINAYILKTPLPEKELETILRDEAFKKPAFYRKNTFLHEKFACFLKNELNIVKINDQLHYYKDGVYVSGIKKFGGEMLKILPELPKTKRVETYQFLDESISENQQPADANYLPFSNGIYDIANDSIIDFSPDKIFINRINWVYNPGAYDALVDRVLDTVSCNDANIRALLEEIAGYCLYRRNELGKAFVLTGEKDNGKSTYLDMIQCMLGENNVSALDLGEVNERFLTAELFGKLANVGDDIGDEFIPNTGVFKKLVTGESLKGERKGQDPFFFRSYAKLLFSANNIPRLGRGRDSAAIAKRLIIVPFNAKINRASADFKPFIKYELERREAMEYLIILAVEGLKRVLSNNRFTECETTEKAMEEYEETNNPVIGFFKSVERWQIVNEPTKDVYRMYQVYAAENNIQALSTNEFSKQVKKYFRVEIAIKKIKGATQRIFANE